MDPYKQRVTTPCVSVGIGILLPVSGLEIPGSTTNSSAKFGTYEIQSYAVNNAWLSDNIYYNGGFLHRSTGYGALSYFNNGGFEIRTAPYGTAGTPAATTSRFVVTQEGAIGLGGTVISGSTTGANLVVTSAGDVGVGVQNPAYKLDVAGSINAAGNVTATGNIAAKYQDIAEWVPASIPMPPGTVVVLNREHDNEVTPSVEPYDSAVAGVVSGQPGIVLGEASATKAKIATTGRVKVRVDASTHPIAIGDLLVTSGTTGAAMKSEPLDIGGTKIHRPGTLIGKALEPLPSGEGEILVLLSLQ